MSLNKVLALIFAFLLIIVGVESFYFINQDKTKTSITPTVIPTNYIEPSPELKILFQASDDKEGRTVVYSDTDVEPHDTQFYIQHIEQINKRKVINGYFQQWEALSDSQDRYFLLNNIKTNKLMIKVRVVFSQTVFDVINLNTNKISNNNASVSSLSDKLLKNLFKQGDYVLVVPLVIDGKVKIDLQKNIIAKALLIQRFSKYLPDLNNSQ